MPAADRRGAGRRAAVLAAALLLGLSGPPAHAAETADPVPAPVPAPPSEPAPVAPAEAAGLVVPVEVVAPVPAPPAPAPPVSTQATLVWDAQRLERGAPAATDDGLSPRFDVRTGSGHVLTASEFAALTGDANGTLELRHRLAAARNQRGWLYAVGGVLGAAALLELGVGGTDTPAEEDHLWRGLVLVGAASIPVAAGPLRVSFERARARHVALQYAPREADALIERYNAQLRGQLGLPPVAGTAPVPEPTEPGEDDE